MNKVVIMAEENILQVGGITKRFPGVLALDKVSFGLKKGEVHAIVGENGAGKSTLMHILGGLYKQNAGQIVLEGGKVAFSSPVDAQKHGISIVFSGVVADGRAQRGREYICQQAAKAPGADRS